MGIESTVEKLDKYYKRFNEGKAARIKPTHVDKAIRKLTAREELLLAELAETEKPSKKTRLEGKLATVREQLERARWLCETLKKS